MNGELVRDVESGKDASSNSALSETKRINVWLGCSSNVTTGVAVPHVYYWFWQMRSFKVPLASVTRWKGSALLPTTSMDRTRNFGK
jgi:hypothetical protein